MSDYGSQVADKAIAKVEREIRHIYAQAEKELTKKLEDFVKAKEKRSKKKLDDLAKGLITEDEYKNWLAGQVFTEKQWKDKLDQASRIMVNANEEAAEIVHNNKLNVFAENYNHTAFEIEKDMGADINFNVYNTHAVARLVKTDPDVLPKWNINEGKDYVWNYDKAKMAVTQGIIQGESIPRITKRLSESLSSKNENKMRTFARTAITGAQNAGRMETMHDAEKMGIDVRKKWLATLDGKTRDAHRDLDGQIQDIDDPFDSELGDIMFPGDPSAAAGNVYNCRCRLIYVLKGVDYKSVRRDEDGELVEDMTYKEWLTQKQKDKKVFTGSEDQSNIDNRATKNNTERVAQSDIHLESDAQKLQAMRNYSSLDEESIKSAAEALFGYGADPEYCYFDGADSDIRKMATPEASKRADAIQKYIDASPKAEGRIFRGMGLPKETLDSLIVGEEFDERKFALSSWSTDETVGQRYASNSVNKYGGERVVFEYSNPKHGTPVAHLSLMYTEKEVLVNNKDVAYRIIGKEEYVKSSKTLGDRKFTRIILEEIGD